MGGRRLFKTGFLLVSVLIFPVYLLAETVILKSGKKIEGRIIERTNEYIKIESRGDIIHYYLKYIRGVEEGKPEAPLANNKDSAMGPEFYLKKGLSLASEGKFKEAEEEFKNGFNINNSNYNINGALNIIEDLKKELISQDYAAYLFKGSYHLINGEYRDAIADLGNAFQIKPNDLNVCYNLGVAYYRIAEYGHAIEYLSKAIDLKSDDAETYGFLGSVYYSAGQYQKSKDNLLIAKRLFQEAGDQKIAREVDKFINSIPAEGLSP